MFTNIPWKSRGKNKPIIRNKCLLPANSEFCVFPASAKEKKTPNLNQINNYNTYVYHFMYRLCARRNNGGPCSRSPKLELFP